MKSLSKYLFLTTSCLLSLVVFDLQAEDEKTKVFNEIYGSQIAAVQKSRGTDDDLKLAQELFDASESLADDPEVAVICLENAAILALRSPVGYELTIQAVESLKQKEAFSKDHAELLIEAHQKKYRANLREDRQAAATEYAEVLIETGHYLSLNGDTTLAQKYYRQAQPLARSSGSISSKQIVEFIKSAQALARVDQEIEDLKKKLIEEPTEADALKLAQLYLLQQGNFAKAAEMAAFSGDETMKSMLGFTQQPMEDIAPLDQFKVGDWLLSQAENANTFIKGNFYNEARHYLESFLANHEKKDIFTIKAARHLEKIEEMQAQALAAADTGSTKGRSSARIRAIEKALGYKLKRRPKEAVKIGKKYYLLINEEHSFDQATANAKKAGGYLLALNSEEESKAIIAYLKQAIPNSQRRPMFRCFMGVTDEHKEGDWRWINGEPLTVKYFRGHEPNNAGGREHHVEARINLQTGDMNWNDIPKNARNLPYIIEWEF